MAPSRTKTRIMPANWKIQPPVPVRWLYSGTFWRKETKEKTVLLTFDDGPVPGITQWVCNELKKRDVKATFFCVGENVKRYPEIYRMVKSEGHKTGNHTFNHTPAWKCSGKTYFENVRLGAEQIDSELFRPPHGQLYPWYVPSLKKTFKKIVMWDVLSKDYNKRLTYNEVFNNVKNNVRPGSVIVFHDSVKALPRLEKALPLSLDYLLDEGYEFELL